MFILSHFLQIPSYSISISSIQMTLSSATTRASVSMKWSDVWSLVNFTKQITDANHMHKFECAALQMRPQKNITSSFREQDGFVWL